jgi:predicted aspartyl protease
MEKYTVYEELPAAPELWKITIKNPYVPKKTNDLKALIDSGASRTVIPENLIKTLNLVPVRVIKVKGYKEGKQKHKTYFVDVEFKGYSFPNTEVIAVKRKNVLLGRDILNKTILVLDGKNLSYDIKDP